MMAETLKFAYAHLNFGVIVVIRPAAIFVASAIIIMVATILTIIYLRFIFVLSLALLGLLCCTRTSSTCRERGYFVVEHRF